MARNYDGPSYTSRHDAQRTDYTGYAFFNVPRYTEPEDADGADVQYTSSGLPRLKRNIEPEEQYYGPEGIVAEFDVRGMLIDAVAEASARTAKTLIDLATILENKIGTEKFIDASREVAVDAQHEVVRAYQQARRRSKRAGVDSYRADDRFAHQKLLAGLRDPNFSLVNEEGGIIFGIESVLNNYALQWRRLNFGAGDQSGNPPRSFVAQGSNLIIGAYGLVEDPAEAFRLPGGFWATGQHEGQFFVAGGDPAPKDSRFQFPLDGRSIRAENWLDYGVKYIADNIGPAWLNAYKEKIYEPAAERARAGSSRAQGVINRTQLRPRKVKFRTVNRPRGTGFFISVGRI